MSIGEALAAARRDAGLTVAHVSQRTRIRQTIIRGIERDDYSSCGGDFYARGHIRAVAKVVGADSRPLIREYDTAHRAPGPISATGIDELVTLGRTAGPRGPNWTLVMGLALVASLGFLAYYFLSGSGQPVNAAPVSGSHAVTHHHATRSGTSQAPKTTPGAAVAIAPSPRPTVAPSTRPTVTAAPPASAAPAPRPTAPEVRLTPAGAEAASAGGGQGDNPQLAHLAIDGSYATAWHTDWYTTAGFGNLYSGTGLLLDMGHPVTVTGAQVTLGSAPGASFQIRAGADPADLPPAGNAADAEGVVHLRFAAPAHGRYVLLWFTRLPPDQAGTYQASVYDIRLTGPG